MANEEIVAPTTEQKTNETVERNTTLQKEKNYEYWANFGVDFH